MIRGTAVRNGLTHQVYCRKDPKTRCPHRHECVGVFLQLWPLNLGYLYAVYTVYMYFLFSSCEFPVMRTSGTAVADLSYSRLINSTAELVLVGWLEGNGRGVPKAACSGKT